MAGDSKQELSGVIQIDEPLMGGTVEDPLNSLLDAGA